LSSRPVFLFQIKNKTHSSGLDRNDDTKWRVYLLAR
jgi:hypothetical protein